jgi:hypothetical protein
MDIETAELQLEITKTDWHDGRLVSVTYITSPDTTSVVLSLEIHADHESRERHAVRFKFVGVRDFTHASASSELQDHHAAGNIGQARFNSSTAGLIDLSVFLTGGYLRIVAESVITLGDADAAVRSTDPTDRDG